MPGPSHNGAIAPDGRTAYVGSQQQGATGLVVIDLARGVERTRVPLDRTPRALDVSPDGRWLYYTVAGDDAVQVLDTATNQPGGRIPVGASPHHAPFTPDGRRALVPSQGPGELAIVDVAGRSVGGVVGVGKTPHWVTASSDGRTRLRRQRSSGDVRWWTSKRSVLATIPVGQGPGRSPRSRRRRGRPPPVDRERGGRGLRLRARVHHGPPGAASPAATIGRARPQHQRPRPGRRSGHRARLDGRGVVTLPSAGVVPFFCSSNAALGQRGELVATAPRALR